MPRFLPQNNATNTLKRILRNIGFPKLDVLNVLVFFTENLHAGLKIPHSANKWVLFCEEMKESCNINPDNTFSLFIEGYTVRPNSATAVLT